MSAAVFPVQLKEMMRMNGRVVGWAASSPITPLPSHHHHCMHTSSWEIVGSAYCQGVLGHRPVGHLTWWESSPPAPKIQPPLPTHEKENKTWGWHCDSSSAVLSHITFAISLSYAYIHFPSSLSSAQAINSVNWLTPSLHWLRSLIKGLLIGTLFNTGPCRESCPLILSRQQPFPVCQSLNVINYVGRLSRYFVTCVYTTSV